MYNAQKLKMSSYLKEVQRSSLLHLSCIFIVLTCFDPALQAVRMWFTSPQQPSITYMTNCDVLRYSSNAMLYCYTLW